ncbi:UDP-N-acetylmuramoyl-L-alanine--D-glutamate ligase [Amylibacter sp.]|nr:UDP-N-acetylmuramoyl-L-alanine--D-glutamate ligase [Amylibacter sp.]
MRGQTVVILGLARQGIALARYLSGHGAIVRASDLRTADALGPVLRALGKYQIDFVLGEHPQSLLDGTDIIFVSGGVPSNIPLLQQARERDIPLSNDSQLFLERAPCKVVGITGSAGKSTATVLAGRIADSSRCFRKAWVGGNVGNPLIADVHRMTSEDVAIMELSSFQLEIMTASPTVSVILNITPNHLDRHKTMKEYVEVKASILDGQRTGDIAVLGWDDYTVRGLRERVRGHCWGFSLVEQPGFMDGCHIDGDSLILRREGFSSQFAEHKDIHLRGEHNKLNVLAAATLAAAVGVDPKVVPAAIRGFEGAPHRLEMVRDENRVRWVNDTMATTPERTLAALRSFTAPVILLLGGRDKDLPWGALAERVKTGVKAIVLFGEAAVLIERALEREWNVSLSNTAMEEDSGTWILDGESGLESQINGSTIACSESHPSHHFAFPDMVRVKGLEEAVGKAVTFAEAGDVVLLSPGCTSYDDFSDASARGERFRELVQVLL